MEMHILLMFYPLIRSMHGWVSKQKIIMLPSLVSLQDVIIFNAVQWMYLERRQASS